MALIAMCVYDTLENGRTVYTNQTFQSLIKTVDFNKHRIGVYDNGSCEESKTIIDFYIQCLNRFFPDSAFCITSETNEGTAFGINEIWKLRKEGEHCVKMDNDCVIHDIGWLDQIEEAFTRSGNIQLIGLKRKDLEERADHDNLWYKSELVQLPHERGQRWIVLEVVKHCIGTCQVYSSELLDKFGYLWQNSSYSLDDSYASHRVIKLGYQSAFLPHIEIDHIDTGEAVDYIQWKRDEAGRQMQDYNRIVDGIYSGKINPYYDGIHKDEWSKYKEEL